MSTKVHVSLLMIRSLFLLLLVWVWTNSSAIGDPPFWGTIFVDPDIITASATAYVNALNRMLAAEADKDDSFLVGSLGGGELLTRSSLDDAVNWSDASRLH